jgi:hypothetical protein
VVYVAGRMRGVPRFNFAEFDRVGGLLLSAGFKVISPADIDREHGFDPWDLPEDFDWGTTPDDFDLRAAYRRDMLAMLDCTHICLLDGWTSSVGARCEYFAARWLGLRFVAEVDGKIFELSEGWEPVCPVDDAQKEGMVLDSLLAAVRAEPDQPESILDEARRITGGDRQAQYGPPDQDFRRTAAMWTGLFGDLLKDGARFEPKDVAKAMILLKLSRLMHSAKRDSVVDIAGYAHCLAVCYEQAGGFTS